MNKERIDIPYPDEDSIQMEINTIIAKGLNPKASFGSYLAAIYRSVGFRHLFHDWTEILYTLFITLFVLAVTSMSVMEWIPVEKLNIYTFIFIGSPITYFVFAYVFFVNQKQKATYEVEMTCKYNLHQLAAFRMLVFSVLSMLINSVIILSISLHKSLDILHAFLLSSSALFLFALAFLYVQLHMKSFQAKLTVTGMWVLGNILVSIHSVEFYEAFLQQIPFYIYGLIGIVAAGLYIRSLKGLLFAIRMKGLV
ncbi:hypothetical protein JOC33_002001 [Thalassobacillus pellis]|nr:hypothetical protein [Thalassobacillus pellis]